MLKSFLLHGRTIRLVLNGVGKESCVSWIRTAVYLVKESTAPYCCHVESHGNSTCTLTPNGHLTWITTKGCNVVLNPL